jgi:hypothetical protein
MERQEEERWLGILVDQEDGVRIFLHDNGT